jgi:hypothetical protein
MVIPKRHPYDCYQSHVTKPGFDLSRFIGWWHEIIHRSKGPNAFLFPIAQKDEELEKAACDFVGIKWSKGFPWVPVGVSDRDRNARDYEHVADQLQFAVDWFNG